MDGRHARRGLRLRGGAGACRVDRRRVNERARGVLRHDPSGAEAEALSRAAAVIVRMRATSSRTSAASLGEGLRP